MFHKRKGKNVLQMTNKKHPQKSLLVEYAEGLIDSTARLNPEVAFHISECSYCRNSVEAMQKSFRVIEEVETIEPRGDLTAAILLAARNTPVMPAEHIGGNLFGRLAAAAVVVFAAGFAWEATHQTTAQFVTPSYESTTPVIKSSSVQARNTEASPTEELLSNAVLGSHRAPGTDWERAQHRALHTYNDDIAEAELALANNPALIRASDMIASSRQRKDRTLRNVYTESR